MHIEKVERIMKSFRYCKMGLSCLRDISYMDYKMGFERAFSYEGYLRDVFLKEDVLDMIYKHLELEILSEIWVEEYEYVEYLAGCRDDIESSDAYMSYLKREVIVEILKNLS